MRPIALIMADGQLAQADALLCDPWTLEPNLNDVRRRGYRRNNLEVALAHMRSAAGWLGSAAS